MPTLRAFDDAMLRHGRSVPAVNRLGGGTIAMAGPGQPWRVTGDTAAVYQLRQPSGRLFALRCPLADPADLEFTLADRYRALAADPNLAVLRAAPASPLIGGITYVAGGILLPAPDFRSMPHPVMALEWIAGPTLAAAVARAARELNRAVLRALADAWVTAVDTAGTARFSHGDLSASNTVVRPDGTLAFVDYDTCFWPGSPRPPKAPPRWGYAHPSGRVPADPERRDDFPALLIYASLRVLAFSPALRSELPPAPDGHDEPLLLSERDLRDPDASRLIARLEEIGDPGLRFVLDLLWRACEEPVERTPLLYEVVDGERVAVRAARIDRSRARPIDASPREPASWSAPSGWSVPAPPPPRAGARRPESAPPGGRARQDRLTRLNSLLMSGDEEAAWHFWETSGLRDDPDAAHELGERMAEIERRRRMHAPTLEVATEPSRATEATIVLPGTVPPTVAHVPSAEEEARRRRHDIDRLDIALDAGDAATVVRLWPELRTDARASRLAVRANDVLAERLRAAITAAITRGDEAAIVGAVQASVDAGVAVDPSARRAARTAAERLQLRREVAAALATDDREALAALAVSGRIDELGSLEPSALRRVRRAVAWPSLERALAADDDTAILAAYDSDLFADRDALTDQQRSRIDLAGERTRWLTTVRAALRHRDRDTLWRALEEMPAGADAHLTPVERARIERIAAREEAVAGLAAALRDGSDRVIVEALAQVEAVGAALPERLDWSAIRGVVDRISLTEAIEEARRADPPDYVRLAWLLTAARASGLGLTTVGESTAAAGLSDAVSLDLGRLEADMLRAAHLHRLRDAIAAGDDAAISAAADPDPYGAISLLTAPQRLRVEQAIAARRRR